MFTSAEPEQTTIPPRGPTVAPFPPPSTPSRGALAIFFALLKLCDEAPPPPPPPYLLNSDPVIGEVNPGDPSARPPTFRS